MQKIIFYYWKNSKIPQVPSSVCAYTRGMSKEEAAATHGLSSKTFQQLGREENEIFPWLYTWPLGGPGGESNLLKSEN